MSIVKAFKLLPFNKEKEQLPTQTRLFYVDVETRQDYWKDIVVITSNDKDGINELQNDLSTLKNHPKFKDKFVIFNPYTNAEDKIEYFVLEELEGKVQ